jgi:mannose-6-phosphate isomerase-like protein (cupin superfamily)
VTAIGDGDGRHVWFSGNLMTIKHDQGWTFLESRMQAGHAPPLHYHRHEDEAFYVLEGTMRFRRGDETFDVAAGDFVVVPAGMAHAFVVGPDGVRALQVATTADLAAFVDDAGEPAPGAVLPDGHDVDRAAMQAAAERHGMVVVGPPLA